MSLNKVLLIGRCGNDPDVRTVSGDKKVARISLATSERRKDKNGEYVEETTWHTVQVWDKSAEFVENYVRKGAQLFVEGRIRTRKYTDQTGVEKFVTEIAGDSIQLLDPRRTEERQEEQQQRPSRPAFVPDPAPAPARRTRTAPAAPAPVVEDLPEDGNGLPF